MQTHLGLDVGSSAPRPQPRRRVTWVDAVVTAVCMLVFPPLGLLLLLTGPMPRRAKLVGLVLWIVLWGFPFAYWLAAHVGR